MKPVAIIGTGPAGLMAAHAVRAQGYEVRVFEKRKSAGRKLLVAGSSGLNISYDAPLEEFIGHYRCAGSEGERCLRTALGAFPPSAWIEFVEGLGIPTFKGTSRRYFVEEMKASGLLKAWLARLEDQGVVFEYAKECVGFRSEPAGVSLEFADGSRFEAQAACFALGGGSWEKSEKPLRWPAMFERQGVGLSPFVSSNVGFQVDWPKALLEEAEGSPIKNVVLHSSRGSRAGDLVVTAYGLEGTPIYFAGEAETVHLDLKPDLSRAEVLKKLRAVKENLSPMRRVKKTLSLGPGALALAYHLGNLEGLAELGDKQDALERAADLIKRFPIELRARQPLDEAISSSGGVRWGAVDPAFMLKDHPGVFVAGEMLDWDAPTGGFLIQGCVSTGALAGRSLARRLQGFTQGL